MKYLIILTALVSVSSCNAVPKLPFTQAEKTHRFSYVPVDPAPARTVPDEQCPVRKDHIPPLGEDRNELDKVYADQLQKVDYEFVPLPLAFPDNAVRIAYKTFDGKGTVSYGPVAATGANQRYQIVIDFINSDVTYYAVDFDKPPATKVQSSKKDNVSAGVDDRSRLTLLPPGTSYLRTQQCMIEKGHRSAPIMPMSVSDADWAKYDAQSVAYFEAETQCSIEVNKTIDTVKIPVYIGVGLRVVADIVTVKAGAKLGGLPGIAAAADAGIVNGSLVVQTLGINGEPVTSALPLQSELSASSVQSALIAIGSIKTNMYDDDVELRPRIVGFYNAIGASEEQVIAIAAELSANRANIEWHAPCRKIKKEGTPATQAPDPRLAEGIETASLPALPQ